MNKTDHDMRISPATESEIEAGLDILLSNLPEPQRRQQVEILIAARSAQISTSGDQPNAGETLFVARRGDRMTGAVYYQRQAGRTAVLWPPQVSAAELQSTAAQLLEVAMDHLSRENLCLVQSLIAVDAQVEAELLRAAGLEHVADLLYLVCLAGEFPIALPTLGLEFEPYRPKNADRLARLIESTYVETRDCPSLNGIRNVEDVLAGYRASGKFDPDRWLIVRSGDKDIGCLILTEHAGHGIWEVGYMGIVPEARGCRSGMAIVRHAQWLAGQAGQSRMVLAVDASNEPALRMYGEAGFQSWDRKAVYLKIYRS